MREHAVWIACDADVQVPRIRRTFAAKDVVRAEIDVTGLGYFELYLNGMRVGEDYFVPAQSDYIRRDLSSLLYPIHDTFTHRVYYLNYDLSALLLEGENVLELVLGNGYYRQTERIAEGKMAYGDELCARYVLRLFDAVGNERLICSDGSETFQATEIIECQLFLGELHDFTAAAGNERAVHVISLDSELTPQLCPTDRCTRVIRPRLVRREGKRAIYDAGEVVSGFAVLQSVAGQLGEICVSYSEELNAEGGLDAGSTGWNYRCASGVHQMQSDSFVLDGKARRLAPRFCWHAFRYFAVSGEGYDAQEVAVEVVHSDVAVNSSFDSDSEALNWLYEAYIRTQLDSMHGGVPFDCPHRERLGYTGDGQVCCDAAMLLLDSRAFYEKWMRDVLDCQDATSGHVQHTAPFMGGGGGPCGWGGAVIELPYRYWRRFGDRSRLAEWYDGMRRYVDYICSRSENGLVVREEAGGWCLGDWASIGEMKLPEAYVNSTLFVRQLDELSAMADALDLHADEQRYTALAAEVRAALLQAYYDAESGSFCGGIQGADAYALMIGLAPDGRTLKNLVDKYWELGYFDTGFIGTDVLVEQLLRHGEVDLAYALLTTEQKGSYLWLKRQGATTLYEYFDGRESHCHPMFGAPMRSVFRYMLGLDVTAGNAVRIAPCIPSAAQHMSGSVMLDAGALRLGWRREGGIHMTVEVPQGICAVLCYGGREIELAAGENQISFE